MAGNVQITARRYPELHRAAVALLGPRKTFRLPEHFETWLPNAEDGLRGLRRRDADRWQTFVAGHDLAPILRIRDGNKMLRGDHKILDYMAN